ncbi:galactose-1-epimerase [Sphingobacterium faecium]|uniref:aldose epimerase family protein n=1 Tax=Sphingobacterium faecium TaxID=34087 RepID=UPI0012912D9F|nr:aldose epimerase family protein [Sphingobacterium faecium]MQP28994.1 galactose-1-epimerase [Sphingobacterium faecium]
MNNKVLSGLLLTSAIACACQQNSNKQHIASSQDTTINSFDTTIDNKDVKLYTLANGKLKAALTNYGARLVNLQVPDQTGQLTDVILGYDSAAEYKAHADNFYGAIVGRYGNRIGDATFTLQGVKYELEKNDGKNSLHGGTHGVYNQVWDVAHRSDSSITFTYLSPDGEAGYPGKVNMQVTYTLNHTGGLVMDYQANTDKETVLNLTNHAYFNLSGAGSETILDHELQIDGEAITEVDDTLIPTGKSIPVAGTPFDFRKAFVIGDRIEVDNAQLKIGKGYDHNFELAKSTDFRKVAAVYAPKTGIEMQVWTTEPGLQFYSGNFMSDTDPKGKNGLVYPFRSAFCLETQHYPDAPNHSSFASTVVKPDQTYKTKSEYRFKIR